MEIEVELTRDDVVAFNMYNIAHSPALQRQRLLTVCIAVALLLILPLLITATSQAPAKTAIAVWPLWLAPFVFLALMHFHVPQRQKQLLGKCLDEGKNTSLVGKRLFRASPSGITESHASGENTVRWQAIERVVVTEAAVYFYSSAISAFIIPRRAFADESNFQAFVSAAQHYRDRAAGAGAA